MEGEQETHFAKFGVYSISDSLDLSFPGVDIKFQKVSSDVFSYMRRDDDNNTFEKMIPLISSELTIEIAPIRPLNYPAKRTNYFFLDFETPVFLPENSSATFYVQCPIEIGIFLLHDSRKDSLDWFTCDPFNSRFGLYGTPETGTLCKYSKVQIVDSYSNSHDFFNGVIKINLENQLVGGHSITKLIFPISETSVYYNESKAIYDSLSGILRKKITLELLDIDPQPIETDWTKSPTYDKSEIAKRMDIGVD